MRQIAIRCHPSVPVDPGELEDWLEGQIEQLRGQAPGATVRLARLTQQLPSSEIHLGWLLELELIETNGVRAEAQLGEVVRDMRLLGFQPTVLTPVKAGDGLTRGSLTNGTAR
jgi:hypothetical protein